MLCYAMSYVIVEYVCATSEWVVFVCLQSIPTRLDLTGGQSDFFLKESNFKNTHQSKDNRCRRSERHKKEVEVYESGVET